jgi:hypothetical protein
MQWTGERNSYFVIETSGGSCSLQKQPGRLRALAQLRAPIASKRYSIESLTPPVPDYRPQSCQLYAASGQMAIWSLPCGMEQRPPGTADLIGTPTPGISECRTAKQPTRSPFWTCKSSMTYGREFHRGTSAGRHVAELEKLPQL